MAKTDFIENLRTAVGVFDREFRVYKNETPDDAVQWQLLHDPTWLTPDSVEGFDCQDFTELTEQQRVELDLEVQRFRNIAARLSPGDRPSDEHVREAMPHFRRIVELVREAVLPRWQEDLKKLLNQAEEWCAEKEWPHKRRPKTVRERLLGTYEVEKLQFHTFDAGFMLDPIARFVSGALGLVDLYVLPTLDSVSIVRTFEDTWEIAADRPGGDQVIYPWGKEGFRAAVRELAKYA